MHCRADARSTFKLSRILLIFVVMAMASLAVSMSFTSQAYARTAKRAV